MLQQKMNVTEKNHTIIGNLNKRVLNNNSRLKDIIGQKKSNQNNNKERRIEV